ncbi:hypothetical protein MTO96_010947 [Rhipicephalus appendiculatus]
MKSALQLDRRLRPPTVARAAFAHSLAVADSFRSATPEHSSRFGGKTLDFSRAGDAPQGPFASAEWPGPLVSWTPPSSRRAAAAEAGDVFMRRPRTESTEQVAEANIRNIVQVRVGSRLSSGYSKGLFC